MLVLHIVEGWVALSFAIGGVWSVWGTLRAQKMRRRTRRPGYIIGGGERRVGPEDRERL